MMKTPDLLPRWIKSIYGFFAVVLVCALLIENPLESSYVTSIVRQEFVLAHLADAADYFSAEETGEDAFRLATGTYESQKDGELFGAAKGRNLIVVQLESMQGLMLQRDYYGQEITPFLNQLIEEDGTIYFDNFYHQLGAGNTSDAEFAVNNSILGSIESYTYQLYQNNYFKGLPWILKENGYDTNVFHGYKKSFWNRENVYPTLGFDTYYGGEDYVSDNIKGIGAGNIVGISDSAFYKQTVAYMENLPEPFYGFVITLSSHNPFGLPKQLQKIRLKECDENIVGRYIQSVNYADRCLAEFFDELKASGLYENSLILIYGDHFGLSKADEAVSEVVSNWLGRTYTYEDMLRVPFLIHIPGSEVHETISISGGQTDIFPTAAYLLGIEELDNLYLGQNLLTAVSGFVAFQMHLLKGSFIKDDIVFEMSRDGVFENSRVYNRKTGEELSPGDYYEDSQRAKEIIELSELYLRNDVLRLAIEKGYTETEIRDILSGQSDVRDALAFYEIDASDADEMERMYREITEKIRKDESFTAVLCAENMPTVLAEIESRYSGVSGRKETILSVDESLNADYLAFREHVYPVVEKAGELTKAEYSGYKNVILRPEPSEISTAQLLEFVVSNQPAGILMDRENSAAYGSIMRVFEEQGVLLYAEGPEGVLKARARECCFFTGSFVV